MKPIVVLGAGLVALAGFGSASGGYMKPPTDTIRVRPQPKFNPPVQNFGAPPPSTYRAPAYGSGVIGETRFRPYGGQSVYSNRGGLNAYPAAPKPRGSLSPYGAGGTSVYTSPYTR